jgi:superfamily I DNA/RNA helicase
MPRSLVLLSAAACTLSVANVYYAQPLLDALALDFNISHAAVGGIITATQVGCAVSLLLLVPLGDVVDRRRLMAVQLLALVAALAVVGCARSAYMLEAGPGTGKTQTLSARIESLLDDGTDPRRILVLTFSNKAAGEMAGRLARKRPVEASAMWIGTFHAFGLDIIRRFHAELGLPANPRLMDKTEAVELIEKEFPKLNLQHYRDLYDPTQKIADILAAISRAKDEVVDAAEYTRLANAIRASVPAARTEEADEALEVAEVYRCYERLKQAAQCVDFGDLVSLPVHLLEGNAAVREHLSREYDHVLVDEYQDVNRSSVLLLKAVCGAGEISGSSATPSNRSTDSGAPPPSTCGVSAAKISRAGREAG